MEYNSFYGGRRGASFVIVKQYPDIPSMVNDFKQGGAFTEVNYDEYVIIDTVNKNHPDNGKLFRRGYDYNGSRTISAYRAYKSDGTEIINGSDEDYTKATYVYDEEFNAGGTVYVGSIVGPAGRAPMVTMTTYAAAEEKSASEGFDERKSHGEYAPTENLLPGKYIESGTTKFNDTIQWYCTSIRNEHDEDSEVYVGFKIPYTVIDYETQTVEPYNASGIYTDMTAAIRTDDGTHPFYEKWKIAVPNGVKGESLRNFRVIVPEEDDVIYTPGTTTQYSGFEDDVTSGRMIMVYDYYNYDSNKNPERVTYYLGDYNEISDFTIDDNGTVTIAYTHGDTTTYSNLIHWITDVTLNEDLNGNSQPGHMIVRYNQNDYDEYDLDWVQNLTFDNDGTVHVNRTVSGITDLNQLIYWIQSVSLNSTQGDNNEGLLNISFNHGEDLTAYLKWVNDITLSNNGQVTLHYSGNGTDKVITDDENFIKWINNIACSNTGTVTVAYNDNSTDTFENAVKWVSSVEFNDDGDVIVHYNNGTNDTYENEIKWIEDVTLTQNGVFTVSYAQENIEDYSTQLTWPRSLAVNTGSSQGTNSQKLVVTYNTGSTEEIGNPINYIMKTRITSDNHLIVLYSSPNKRNSVIADGKAYMAGDQPAIIDNFQGWLDLGSIKAYNGILTGLNITKETLEEAGISDITVFADVINYLNTQYPYGLGRNTQGITINSELLDKLITVGDSDASKYFYGFDYDYVTGTNNYKGWYYIGQISVDIDASSFICVEPTENENTSGLQNGGVWLVIEKICEITYNLTNMTITTSAGDSVEYGDSFEATFNTIPAEGYSITMGGENITSSVYNTLTRRIYITQVTDDIVITASAS